MKTEEAPDRVGPPPEVEVAAGTTREDIRRGLRHVLAVFLTVRVGLFILALVGVALIPALRPQPHPPGWPLPGEPDVLGWQNVFTAWERFDALWFLRIASSGYVNGDGSAAFFPLYPLLTRWLAVVLGGHPFAAALVVSNASFFGALLVLYFLTRTELSEQAARRAVVYAAVFPTAFFFLAPYSESLFFLLAVTSIWAARRGRWTIAAVAGALAALTRNVGLLLAIPLAVEGYHQWRERRTSLLAPAFASATTAAGILPYLGFWRHVSGDWLAPLHQQVQWQRTGTFPTTSILKGTKEGVRWIGIYPGGYHQLDWLIVAPVLLIAVYAAIRFRPVYGAYVWSALLAPLSYIFVPRPFMSLPRFVLPLFPVYWVLARWSERRPGLHTGIVACSAALLGVMTLLFVTWYYVF